MFMLHTLSYSPFSVYVCIQYLFIYKSSRLAKKFNDILINYFFIPYKQKTHKNITNHIIILKKNIFIGRLNVKQMGRYFIPHIFHARIRIPIQRNKQENMSSYANVSSCNPVHVPSFERVAANC